MNRALINSVLKLKPSERMQLLDVIYGSLERPDTRIDEIWYDEAERRLKAYKAGKVNGIDVEHVIGTKP